MQWKDCLYESHITESVLIFLEHVSDIDKCKITHYRYYTLMFLRSVGVIIAFLFKADSPQAGHLFEPTCEKKGV